MVAAAESVATAAKASLLITAAGTAGALVGTALGEAARGEPRAGESAMLADGVGRIVGARGRKPAAARRPEQCGQGRRQRPLVEPDKREQRAGGQRQIGRAHV